MCILLLWQRNDNSYINFFLKGIDLWHYVIISRYLVTHNQLIQYWFKRFKDKFTSFYPSIFTLLLLFSIYDFMHPIYNCAWLNFSCIHSIEYVVIDIVNFIKNDKQETKRWRITESHGGQSDKAIGGREILTKEDVYFDW